MPARLAVPVDDGDVRVSLGKERVGEGKADGPRADDEIVGFDRSDGTRSLR